MSWEIAVAFGLGIASIGLVFLSTNLSDDHFPLKLLFLVAGLFMLIIGLNNNLGVLEANNASIGATTLAKLENNTSYAYKTMIWVAVITLSYILIYMFSHTSLKIMGGIKRKGKR